MVTCYTCTKQTLIFICVLSSLNGVVIIILAIVLKRADSEHSHLGEDALQMGLFLFLVSPLGIFGALLRKWYLLILFAFAFALCFLYPNTVAVNIVKPSWKYYENYFFNYLRPLYGECRRLNSTTDEIIRIQSKYNCCGLTGQYGRGELRAYEREKTILFKGCCAGTNGTCRKESNNVHPTSCPFQMARKSFYMHGLVALYLVGSSLPFLYIAIFFFTLMWQVINEPEDESSEDDD